MRPNPLHARWNAGQPATNCWLSFASAYAAETLAHQGWDSLTVDMQHGEADFAAMCTMLTAISTTQTAPLVRVPYNEPGHVMRALDAGAYGVVCPNVDTRAECERFVGACRYAPAGYRSVGPRRAMLYGGADYMRHANTTVVTIVQIESAQAVANVADIASVKGLDMVYVGPSDLGLSLGRQPRADTDDPVVVEAIDTVLAAAKSAGRRSGIYCRSPAYALAMVAKGFDFVTATSDDALLGTGAAAAARFRT